MLKQNSDFIAIAIIALVLGVAQVPRLGVQVARIAMERQAMQMRNVRFEVPVPPMPPEVCEKLTRLNQLNRLNKLSQLNQTNFR